MRLMRKMILTTLIISSSAGFQNAFAADSTGGKSSSEEGLGIKQHIVEWMLTDQKFVEKAAEGSRAEIEISKVALDRAQDQQVKDFAQKMVDDHSQAALELDSIAHSKNYSLPATMDSEHQRSLSNLEAANGAKFDELYVDLMKKDHDKDVSLFAAAADDKKLDPQLQAFAQRKLPLLRSHLQHVRAIDLSPATTSSSR